MKLVEFLPAKSHRGLLAGLALFAASAATAESIYLPCLATEADAEASLTLNQRPFKVRGQIKTLAWSTSADALFAELENESRIVVLEAASGRPAHEARLINWTLSADGSLIAGFEPDAPLKQNRLLIAHTKDGEVLWRKTLEGSRANVRFSEDGTKVLASVVDGSDARLNLYETKSGNQIATWPLSAPASTEAGGGFAYLPDEHALFSNKAGPVVVDLRDGRDVTAEYCRGDWSDLGIFNPFLIPPAGNRVGKLSDSGWGYCDSFKLWGLKAGDTPVAEIEGEGEGGNYFQSVRFSNDGRLGAVFRSADVEVYDLERKAMQGRLIGGGSIGAFSSDGTRLAVVCGDSIQVASTDGKSLSDSALKNPEYGIHHLDVQRDGTLIAASDGASVYLWDTARKGAELPHPALPSECTTVRDFLFHPNGKDFLVTDSTRVWISPLAGKARPVSVVHWDDGNSRDMSLFIPKDGKELAIQRGVKAWFYVPDADFRQATGKFRPIAGRTDMYHPEWRPSFAYSADGKHYLILELGELSILQRGSDKPVSVLKLDSVDDVLACTPDLKSVVLRQQGENDDVALVDTSGGKVRWTIPWKALAAAQTLGRPALAACSESGRWVAVAFTDPKKPSYGVALFDGKTGTLAKVLKIQRGPVVRLVLRKKDDALVVLNGDSTIQVFDTSKWIGRKIPAPGMKP